MKARRASPRAPRSRASRRGCCTMRIRRRKGRSPSTDTPSPIRPRRACWSSTSRIRWTTIRRRRTTSTAIRRRRAARGEHVLCRLFPRRQGRSAPSHHISVQRRPGLLHGLAAHGRVRPEARAHRPTTRTAPAAPYRVVDNEYSLIDVSDLVFIDAPGTGFGHLRGNRQGEGVLRRRSGRACLRQLHRRVSVASQALELAEVSVRRELRHDSARPRSRASSRTRRTLDLNGDHSAVADIELRRQRGRASVQSGCRSALHARAAHLHGDGLVSPQAAESAAGSRAVAARGGEFRAQRLCAGARRGQHAERRAQSPRSRPSCTSTPACPPTTSSAPICASTAGNSRRRCSAARPRPAGSIPGSPARRSIR